MNTEAVRENRSKVTPLLCTQVTWLVLEENVFFFAQRSGPDYFSMWLQIIFQWHIWQVWLMLHGAISHLIQLLFRVDDISSMITSLAKKIKGVLTLGKVSKSMGPRSQPMQENLREDLGAQPLPQGGLTCTSPRLEWYQCRIHQE